MGEPQIPKPTPKTWQPPILWPPSEWRSEPRLHLILDAFFALFALMFVVTLLGSILIWTGVLYHAISASFSSGTHEELRNALLGLAALLGAPFVVWRTIIAAQQTAINRESHYTDLFTKAVEQLSADKTKKQREFLPTVRKTKGGGVLEGKTVNPVADIQSDESPLGEWSAVETTEPNIEARMGAIYALERVAQDSERDHWPIMETLTAYLRNNCGKAMTEPEARTLVSANKKRLAPGDRWTTAVPPPRPDIQAAIRVVGRRSSVRIAREQAQVPRHRLDLRLVCLQRAELRTTNLSEAELLGAWLQGASLHQANLRGADLTGANLEEADLSACDLEGACLITASMAAAYFFEANCRSAVFDFGISPRINFEAAELADASFYSAILDDGKFVGTNAPSTNFYLASLIRADFGWADLTGASLAGSNLMFAYLGNADLRDANLDGANLAGANLDQVKNLTDSQLSKAFQGEGVDLEELREHPYLVHMRIQKRWREWLEERGLTATKSAV